MMTVSLCIVAYNEEEYLPRLLEDLQAQTYSHEQTEILLIDGNSTDHTKEIMLRFAQTTSSFSAVRLFDNPDRIQAIGWNIAIVNARGDIIIRIDAHARIPADFTEQNVLLHEKGEFVTGGSRPCLIDKPTPWKQMLLDAENSLFGSSVSKSRRATSGYVNSLFHAAYRREVFEKAGVFNPLLLRTEDNELHYRIRKAGYRLYCSPDIVSYQYARSNFRRMMRQKFGNGLWIGLTLGASPGCISLFHLAPFCFLLAIVLATVLACFSLWYPLAVLGVAYLCFTLLGTLNTVFSRRGNRWTPTMPFIFLAMHISYGLGTLCGLLGAPFFAKNAKKATQAATYSAWAARCAQKAKQ